MMRHLLQFLRHLLIAALLLGVGAEAPARTVTHTGTSPVKNVSNQSRAYIVSWPGTQDPDRVDPYVSPRPEQSQTWQEDGAHYTLKDLLPEQKGELVEHRYYTLSYSEKDEQPFWVFYKLTPEMVSGPARRSDRFREDPAVSTGSAALSDYQGSGYDRGHLCPAASMSIDQEAMDESFYLSNMSPQAPSFNRGAWKKLEESVRSWTFAEHILFVATGPVLDTVVQTIGANRVTVPRRYYKVIYSPEGHKMIAFLMPNVKISDALVNYAVPVDQVEAATHIDFFSALPDEEEERLEHDIDLEKWNFSSTPVKTKTPSAAAAQPASRQCAAITQKGTRCKRKALPGSNYCYQHQQ